MSEYDPFRFIDETEEEMKPKRNKKEEGLAIDKTHSKQEKSVDITADKTQKEQKILHETLNVTSSETQPKQRKPDKTQGETTSITQAKQLDKKLELFKLEIFTKLDDLNRKIKILDLKDFSELDKICTAYIKQYTRNANNIKKKEGSKTIKTFEYAKELQVKIKKI